MAKFISRTAANSSNQDNVMFTKGDAHDFAVTNVTATSLLSY